MGLLLNGTGFGRSCVCLPESSERLGLRFSVCVRWVEALVHLDLAGKWNEANSQFSRIGGQSWISATHTKTPFSSAALTRSKWSASVFVTGFVTKTWMPRLMAYRAISWWVLSGVKMVIAEPRGRASIAALYACGSAGAPGFGKGSKLARVGIQWPAAFEMGRGKSRTSSPCPCRHPRFSRAKTC